MTLLELNIQQQAVQSASQFSDTKLPTTKVQYNYEQLDDTVKT